MLLNLSITAGPEESGEDSSFDPEKTGLPLYARKIYWKAYNNARYKYRGLKIWFGNNTDPESTAHYVAWEAVKREYENRDGVWQKK